MRKLLSGLVPSLILALAACGASSPAPNQPTAAVNGDGEEMVCIEEKPVGSSIARQVCRTKAQTEMEKKAAQDTLGGPISHPTNTR